MRCVEPSVSSTAMPLSNCTSASAYLPCLARVTPMLKSVRAERGLPRRDFLNSSTASFPRPAVSSIAARMARTLSSPGLMSSDRPSVSTASSALPISSSMSPLCARASAAASPPNEEAISSYDAAASSYLPTIRAMSAFFMSRIGLDGFSLDASANEAAASSYRSRAYSELPFSSRSSGLSSSRSMARS